MKPTTDRLPKELRRLAELPLEPGRVIEPDPQQEAIQQNLTNLNLSFLAQARNLNIQVHIAIEHKQLYPQIAHQLATELLEIAQLLQEAIEKVSI